MLVDRAHSWECDCRCKRAYRQRNWERLEMRWCQHGCHSGKEQEVYNAVRTTHCATETIDKTEWEKIEIMIHGCATMLQTSWVLLIENFMIRRCSNAKFLQLMKTVSSCSRRFLHGTRHRLCELAKLQNFKFWRTCERNTLRQSDNFIVVSWTLFLNTRKSVDSWLELTLISSNVFPFVSTSSCSTSTLCGSEKVTKESSSNMLSPFWKLMRPISQCLAWILLAWVIGLKNCSRLVSWCSGT